MAEKQMQQTLIKTTDNGEIKSVENYKFEPIQGYPMLHWKGKRPFRATQYYPAQLKESYGHPIDDWMNRIYWGDNLQVMSHLLKDFRGKIDLIYIDPPFDSNAEYKKKIKLKGHEILSNITAFEEKQYTDIWANDEYLQFMFERIVMIRELLKTNGTLVLHVDARKGHLLRCIADEVFGENRFKNEIVWHYENKLGTGGNTIDSRHDSLLVYCKGEKQIYNPIFLPVKNVKPQPVTQKIDGKRVWLKDEDGNNLYQESATERPIGDVWTIPIINPVANERTGYPTQKPEALLETVIKLWSNADDLVLDCFMGAGTTSVVSMKLGRRFIGADINLGSIQTTTKRLNRVVREIKNTDENKQNIPGFSVYNVNHYDVFKNPVEAKELLMDAFEIQRLGNNVIYDGEKDGYMVKIMPINRLATKADLSQLVSNFDYNLFEKRKEESPNKPVERIMLVCMGHESDIGAILEADTGYKLEVKVVDVLRDKSKIEFKREAEAKIVIKDNRLIVEAFYPMNLLQKLSLYQEDIEDWRQLVETIMIDWNYDGSILRPIIIDAPGKRELVKGEYELPLNIGKIRVKITDLLCESLEVDVQHA